MVGIGIPIPILDEEILKFTAVSDEEIFAPVIDFSESYPQGLGEVIGEVSYAELRRGEITIRGKAVPTAPLSSYRGARMIAGILKEWILSGEFLLSKPVFTLPCDEKGINYNEML